MTVLRTMLSARQGPLARVPPAGVGARRDDPEVAAGLLQRDQIDVGLGGGRFDGLNLLWALRQCLPQEPLRARAPLGLRVRFRGFACRPRFAPRLTREVLGGISGGGAGEFGGVWGPGRRWLRVLG